MKDFKKLRIWQKGLEIAVDSFKLTETFPKEEKFGLSSQISRAAVSISANIAEGSSRSSEKEYCRFLEISLGSGFELETQLLIAQRLTYGDQAKMKSLLTGLGEEQRMLVSFMTRLNK